MDIDKAQQTERSAAAMQQSGRGVRPGLQHRRQADGSLVIGVGRLRPMPCMTVCMRIDPAVQMHTAVSCCMDVRMQQWGYALQQGEQKEDEAAASAGHASYATVSQPIVVEADNTAFDARIAGKQASQEMAPDQATPFLTIALAALAAGLTAGLAMHRSGFCVTATFRDRFLFCDVA